MYLIAILYFTFATIWLIRQRDRKKALITVLLVGLFVAVLVLATNMEMVNGELRWNPPR